MCKYICLDHLHIFLALDNWTDQVIISRPHSDPQTFWLATALSTSHESSFATHFLARLRLARPALYFCRRQICAAHSTNLTCWNRTGAYLQPSTRSVACIRPWLPMDRTVACKCWICGTVTCFRQRRPWSFWGSKRQEPSLVAPVTRTVLPRIYCGYLLQKSHWLRHLRQKSVYGVKKDSNFDLSW